MKQEQSQSCAEVLCSNKQAEKPAKAKPILKNLETVTTLKLLLCRDWKNAVFLTGFTFLLLPFFSGHKLLSAVKGWQAFHFMEKNNTLRLLDRTLFYRNEIRNKISVCMFYIMALPTSLKFCMLAISWSHFPCLTYRALKNMELAGRLCYYTKLHLKTSTTADCSCPIAEAKLLTWTIPLLCSINWLFRASPFSKEQSSRALPTPCSQHCPI